jgi:hypothetical protein
MKQRPRPDGWLSRAWATCSKRDDAGLCAQGRESDRVDERGVQRFQILLCHLTGDAAGPSNVDRDLRLHDFRDQLGQRRKPDAVDPLGDGFLHESW